MSTILKYRYLILRRLVQVGLMVLFIGGNWFGWNILKGNYSSGLLFNAVPLSDPYAVLQILATGFLAGTDLLIGFVVTVMLYGFFFGRMFCSWVCPMNVVTDTSEFLRKKVQLKPNVKLSKNTRYGVLTAGLILSLISGTPAFEAINPIAILHRGLIFGMGGGWAFIAAIFLFDVAVSKQGWCGHLCPVGAFYSIIGKFTLLKIKHRADNCTNCQKCFKVCPEGQVLDIINIKTGYIRSSACTNCMRCVEVCEDEALRLTLRNPIKNDKTA